MARKTVFSNHLQIIQEMRELFSTSERWTKGFYAKSAKGNMVDFDSRLAVCWCLEGGYMKTINNRGYSDFSIGNKATTTIIKAIKILFKSRINNTTKTIPRFSKFNDNAATTFEDITKVLDLAIEIAREELKQVQT